MADVTIHLNDESKQETDKLMEMLSTMDEKKKESMLIFMQGVKFAENMEAIKT